MKILLSYLFFGACALGLAAFLGPGLMHDYRLRNGTVEADDARVVTAYCKPAQVVLSSCDVYVEVDGREKMLEFDYLMPPGFYGKQQVKVLRGASDPTVFTTSLGQDHLFGRMVVFSVLLGSILGLLALGFRAQASD